MKAQRSWWFLVALLAVVLLTSEVIGGGTWEELEARRKEVLKRLASEPELLINLSPEELPATADMVQLGKRGTPAIANGLINNLDPGVRASCAAVLTATRDARAIEPLLDALEDPNPDVGLLALQALAAVETRQPTRHLLALLKKPAAPGYLKAQALRTMGRAGDPDAVEPILRWFLDTWDPAAQEALWDLRHHLSRRQLQRLILAPLEEDDDRRRPPYEVLAFSVERAGDLRLTDAVDPLVELYEIEPALQNRVIYNLGRIGDDDAVDFLKPLLDRTADARQLNNVAFALDRLGEDVRPFLRAALQDKRAYIRYNAAFVVGDLKARALVPELCAALKDVNDFVRGEAAVALGKIADPAAIPALEAASREDNPVVRRDALLALAHLDYPRYRQRVLDELLSSPLITVRERAMALITAQRDRAALPAVLRALWPDDWNESNLAVAYMSQFDTLDDPDALVFLSRTATLHGYHSQAAALLARFADERALLILRGWVRYDALGGGEAWRALARLKDAHSFPEAERLFEAERPTRERLSAAHFYAAMGRREGADLLIDTLENGPIEDKRVVAAHLTGLNLDAFNLRTRLRQMLAHEDTYVRISAARVLAHHGDVEAEKRLKAELDKKIPFIYDEVMDTVQRLPEARGEALAQRWSKGATPLLQGELGALFP